MVMPGLTVPALLMPGGPTQVGSRSERETAAESAGIRNDQSATLQTGHGGVLPVATGGVSTRSHQNPSIKNIPAPYAGARWDSSVPQSTNPASTLIPSPLESGDPVSESDNPDAIALRAAISILEMQREQSKSDLKRLESIKLEALADPAFFEHELKVGRVRSRDGQESLFGRQPISQADTDDEITQDEEMKATRRPSEAPFASIPAPQSVVRCPPINWAKYHVIGDPLDKLHQEQISRPSAGEPHQNHYIPPGAGRVPEAVISAPYRPFTDGVLKPMVTRSGSKRGSV